MIASTCLSDSLTTLVIEAVKYAVYREKMYSPNTLIAYGKSGKRLIKLNTQAQEILDGLDELWDYTKGFVSHKFKKEARRLGITDIRFHDLSRTFGYKLN